MPSIDWWCIFFTDIYRLHILCHDKILLQIDMNGCLGEYIFFASSMLCDFQWIIMTKIWLLLLALIYYFILPHFFWIMSGSSTTQNPIRSVFKKMPSSYIIYLVFLICFSIMTFIFVLLSVQLTEFSALMCTFLHHMMACLFILFSFWYILWGGICWSSQGASCLASRLNCNISPV